MFLVDFKFHAGRYNTKSNDSIVNVANSVSIWSCYISSLWNDRFVKLLNLAIVLQFECV